MTTLFRRSAIAIVLLLALELAHGAPAGKLSPPRGALWKPDELIVKFRAEADPRLTHTVAGPALRWESLPGALRRWHATNAVASLRPVAHPAWAGRLPAGSSLHGTYILRLASAGADIPALCGTLTSDPLIEYAEPDYRLRASFTPDDPYFSSAGSWGQNYDDQWGLKLAQLPAAWDMITGTNAITVAVIDSGIDFNHPELQGSITTNGWNFINNTPNPIDDFGHGTFCAGIIAAAANNGAGMAGICPRAKILPLKFLDENGYGHASKAASAIDYAINQGVKIINMSFSGPASDTLQFAIDSAHANSAVLVASAGNEISTTLEYPAAYRKVITVGSTDHEDHLSGFSNFGPRIDVVAPGGGDDPDGNSILSLRATNCSPGTALNGLYARWRGTSFSAPFVSGVVALMRTHEPRLQNERIRQILRTTADDILAPGWDWASGYGRVNAFAALQPTNAVITLITSPENFQYVAGTLAITGTAYGIPFAWSVVEWGTGWTPTNWTLLASNSTAVYNNVLASWDTTQVPDGEYSVRLRTADPAGNRYEDRICFSVYNQLYNFDPPTHSGWPQPSGGANASAPVMADLNHDRRLELLWGVRHSMIVKRENGTNFPGWPVPLPGSPRGPASVADLDGDGSSEVGIISDGDGYSCASLDTIFVWNANGVALPGWPKTFPSCNPFAVDSVAPVFVDLDNDGRREVIWCSSGGTNATNYATTIVHADRLDGASLPGWPVALPAEADRTFVAPAVGDVDGDGKLDLAVMTFSGWIYLLHHDGQVFPGWPVKLSGSGLGGTPAMADINHDGRLEVFADTYEGWLCAYRSDGTPMPGWPQHNNGIPWPPAFGDLDGDGRLEIAPGINGPELKVFRYNGATLAGWPPKYGGDWFMPPVIADLDGDGQLDVASADRAGYVRAWDRFGRELYEAGFPVKATTDSCYSGPIVGDVDGDGYLNLVVSGSDNTHLTQYDLWDLAVPASPARMPWPMMMGDLAHQSRYQVPPTLTSVSPAIAVTNSAASLVIAGDHFLQGMRVLLSSVPQPVSSESVTSIVFSISAGLPPNRYDLTVSNVNSGATTLAQALVVLSALDGDDDGDGLPNAWEIEHQLDPFDAGTIDPDNGAAGDPDHDGASNLTELRAGTDPRNAASVFVIKSVEALPAGLVIRWSSVAGKTYAVWQATNLPGPYRMLTDGLQANPPENQFTSPPASAPAFYRVQAR